MPFGVVSGVGRGMGVLDGGADRRREGPAGGKHWAFYCNQQDSLREWRQRALPKYFVEDLLLLVRRSLSE